MTFRSRLALIGGAAALPLVSGYLRSEPLAMDAAARSGASGEFAQLRHGVTHYVDAGPRTGDVIVFLPGATLSLWMWDGLFERFAAAGYRAIRFDRYGMGFSDRPEVTYGPDLFDEQIVDLLDALGVDRPVTLVGVAFACPIIAEFAVRHPDRAGRVCLIAPDGFATPLNLGLRIALLPKVGQPFFHIFGDRALKARVPGYSDDPRIVEHIRARFLPELRYKGFKRALISAIENLPIHGGEALYRRLNAGNVPVQLVWGLEDPVTPMPAEALARDVFSRADIRLLDGVGHLPHFEQLDRTYEVIVDFLGEPHPTTRDQDALRPAATN